MKKLNTIAKLGIATTMAFGAIAPTAMMIQPIHAQEVMGDLVDLKDVKVELVNTLVYTGGPQEQKVKLTYGDEKLIENEDYEIEGNVVTEPGEYTMTIRGKGNMFTGEIEVRFTMEAPGKKSNIAKCDIQLINQLVANGQAQVQQVQVKNGNQVLKEGVDYTVSNNVAKEAGTYTLTVTGMGNEYTGETQIQYTVEKAPEKKETKKEEKKEETNVGLFAALGAGIVALAAGIVIFFKNRKQK